MVSSVSSTSSSTSSSTKTAANSLSANYEMFLQLLTTQLKTQNPLDPMDSTQFTQQLATYASLEQQISTNDKLDSVLSEFDTMSMSNGIGYIGRSIEADTDTLALDENGTQNGTWNYTLDKDATKVTLKVLDSKGNTVWTGTGDTAQGDHAFTWNGKTVKGTTAPAGDYTLQVKALDLSNTNVTNSISVKGQVTAVDSIDGNTVLEIGDTKVKLSSVTRLTT